MSRYFANLHSVNKWRARIDTAHFIRESNLLDGKILSLPGAKAITEIYIDKWVSNKFLYNAVEKKLSIYKSMIHYFKSYDLKKRSKFYNSDMKDMITKAKEDEYSHLILDYCGHFNTYYGELAKALNKNIIKVKGIIAITLAKRGDRGGLTPVKIFAPTRTADLCHTTLALKRLVSFYDNYDIIHRFEYQCRKDSMPMILLILKRIK